MPIEQQPDAGFLRRLVAMLYDSLLTIAILLGVTAINLAIAVSLQGEQSIKEDPFVSLGYWHFPSLWLALYLFYCGFWSRIGQTLGMQAWRLKIVNLDGSDINLKQASMRFLAAHLSFASAGLGWLWMLVDKDKLTLHEKLSATKTVIVAKR